MTVKKNVSSKPNEFLFYTKTFHIIKCETTFQILPICLLFMIKQECYPLTRTTLLSINFNYWIKCCFVVYNYHHYYLYISFDDNYCVECPFKCFFLFFVNITSILAPHAKRGDNVKYKNKFISYNYL